MKAITPYANKDTEELDEIMKHILLFCQIHKIPMFLSLATRNDQSGTEYKNIIYSASAHNLTLKDDKISQYALVANGFIPVQPRNALDFFEAEEGELI